MQLDKTQIVIRERSYGEILDLALRVAWGHALPLLGAGLMGMLPFALFNAWLLNDFAQEIALDSDFDVVAENVMGLMFTLGWVLVLEIPFATALITLYLGQALFVDQPNWKVTAGDFLRSLPQMFLFQGFVRLVLTLPVITIPFLYLGWPYLSEVILLERNPWRSKKRVARISTWRRSWALHWPNAGELMLRWLVASILGVALIGGTWGSLYYLRGLLIDAWLTGRWFFLVELQIAVWFWVAFFAVARFLSYLDLRIRSEGWEVELVMRVEGARLAGELN